MSAEIGDKISSEAATFRSGAAARQAGIPVETLRVWERRYDVVSPSLSTSGQRLYSSEEINRLKLIKRLVDLGNPIGSVAALQTDVLAAMYAAEKTLVSAQSFVTTEAKNSAAVVRVALVGPLLTARWNDASTAFSNQISLRVVARSVNAQDAAQTLKKTQADILVIELSTLNDRSTETILNLKALCQAYQVIVLYRFAPNAVIRRLRADGIDVARGPSDAAEIELVCRALLNPPDQSPSSAYRAATDPAATDADPPHFDEQTLSELAKASSTVDCECPSHLVELVVSLKSFEQYSADCISRSPKDAALHQDLQKTTAAARSLIEGALLRVAIAEGLIKPPKVARRNS